MTQYYCGMVTSLFIGVVLQVILLACLLTNASWVFLFFYSPLGIIVYGGYVIVDIQMIADRIEVDDYIVGAITLYIDLMTLFIYILQALGKVKK